MDKEQEDMQFLGFFGCYKESFNIIFSWRKIFTKITLTLLLPLSFIFLFHIEVSNLIFKKIEHNEEQINHTEQGTPKYEKLTDMVSSEFITLLLFKLVYFTFLLIFSLLSTSAIVYTTASIFTSKDVSYKKVMKIVPKVWKRLMLTFLCAYAAFFAYNVITFIVIILLALTFGIKNGMLVLFIFLMLLYFIGFVYLTLIWQLASVVTVLEDFYGIKAMVKSKELIKGKMGLSILLFLVLNVSFVLIRLIFKVVVVNGRWSFGYVDRIGYGILCLMLLSCFFLIGLVLQTVLYFVCKSYHHENIDKSALADHLEVYLGEYVPLTAKDVQMENYRL
ncbi:uncharacterized protein [Cicer arietinum]|uniref:Uncharacterized protein LOC101496539 n=1 Tax=Cicer arietinum TaxID=3827 RepID=A0A1S2Y2K3_CICAR|nr:uncharacterized protein LOC101496539 [Cicer arietinum]